jgi:hypothetical protein
MAHAEEETGKFTRFNFESLFLTSSNWSASPANVGHESSFRRSGLAFIIC